MHGANRNNAKFFRKPCQDRREIKDLQKKILRLKRKFNMKRKYKLLLNTAKKKQMHLTKFKLLFHLFIE